MTSPLRLLVLLLATMAAAGQQPRVLVRDTTGAEISDARLDWESPVRVRVSAPGFADAVITVEGASGVTVVLDPVRQQMQVTVTALAGRNEEMLERPEAILTGDAAPGPTVPARLEGKPGVMLQQTGAGQVSPFLRGLTGYQVVSLVDGVRFNNAIFRSGPNQYLAFVDPSQIHGVEAMLGPSGTQFGSDGLGGTIHMSTRPARFSTAGLRGELTLGGQSADWGGGGSGIVQWGNEKLWILAGLSGHRHGNLRAGYGVDSRNVLTRLFGYSPNDAASIFGSRQLDTAYSRRGTQSKFAWRPAPKRNVNLWYQRGELHGLRNSKDLWGGLGRLQSALQPQVLDLAYLRYEELSWAGFESVSLRLSLNRQQDGSVRQGLRATDPVMKEWSRALAAGYAAQGLRSIGSHTILSMGAEVYDERVSSDRRVNDTAARPLYPEGSRYRTSGGFGQGVSSWKRFRAGYGLRYSSVRYDNPANPRWRTPASSRTIDNWAWQTSVLFRLSEQFAIHAASNRGFRAPNLNDLGAIGLQDLGYEVPAEEAAAAGALLGDSAGEGALSKGLPVGTLEAERLRNVESGIRMSAGRHRARLQLFDALLLQPIVRRTLLFPASSTPQILGGLPVAPALQTAAQRAQGVTAVTTALDPRAVKAFVNDGRSRYWGGEADWEIKVGAKWTLESSYAFLAGRDLDPNRNIRRLPPQHGSSRLRYVRSRFWSEGSMIVSGAQTRLSGGDLDDERIGASRRRLDIADFYNSARGAQVRGQESLLSILDRVLPGVSDGVRVPLYRETPGWAAISFRMGAPLGERMSIECGLLNALDKNYRVHGSGIDAPGRSLDVRLRWQF